MNRKGAATALIGILAAGVVAGTGVASADPGPGCVYPEGNSAYCQPFGHDSSPLADRHTGDHDDHGDHGDHDQR
ncbi:hypothetical protein GPX89_09645 [Nocardia sp. ET3-3]|uniref:Uncharacterized protein n=1 Tax=Nocardia terrae TaxID=2675851 RepID=A0A7K1UTM4_9NOCA|nr:hypothetical protein [Nocardia terrae]MVU77509.1 hypothetical protein [Nocardia terrae]